MLWFSECSAACGMQQTRGYQKPQLLVRLQHVFAMVLSLNP